MLNFYKRKNFCINFYFFFFFSKVHNFPFFVTKINFKKKLFQKTKTKNPRRSKYHFCNSRADYLCKVEIKKLSSMCKNIQQFICVLAYVNKCLNYETEIEDSIEPNKTSIHSSQSKVFPSKISIVKTH